MISVVLEAKPNVPVSSVKTDLNGNAEKEIPIIRPAKVSWERFRLIIDRIVEPTDQSDQKHLNSFTRYVL